jgi:HSP20 family protein
MLSPFRGFRDMQSEIDRLFGEAFGRAARTGDGAEWSPAMDVVTEDGDIKIRAELPGVKREDVSVDLHNGVLTVSGERNEEGERKAGSGFLIRERRHGSFRRSMTVPEGVMEDDVRASFTDGVLEITVKSAAKPLEDGPKKIEIEGG